MPRPGWTRHLKAVRAAARLAPLLALLAGACAQPLPPACPPADGVEPGSLSGKERTAWVVDDAWHTAIALPAAELTGPLAGFRHVFPGAAALLFGYGKRTWITARVETPGELLLGPFPGPGAVQVVGLAVPPAAAYRQARILRLSLSDGAARRLDGFLWRSFAPRHDGSVRPISTGLFPGSLFYAARQGYALDHDCNRWTADALGAAGLALDPARIVFPAGLEAGLSHLPQACLMKR